jgi:hypothetical protein
MKRNPAMKPINQPASRFTLHFPLFIILAFLLLPLAVTAQDNWTNTGTGAWEDAANWQGGEVPIPHSNINITNGGEARYTLATSDYYYFEQDLWPVTFGSPGTAPSMWM